jgi:uncharacterized membrane protein
MKTQFSIEGLHKRVSASQRDFATAQSNQAHNRKPWKSLAAIAFGLLLSVPGLARAQYIFTTFDAPGASRTAINAISPNAIAGEYDDEKGNTHGFVLKNGVFTTIDAPAGIGAVRGTIINGINALDQLVGTFNVNDPPGQGDDTRAFFESNGSFTTLNPPNASRSQGGFINARGQVVGTYRGILRPGDTNQTRHGFFWHNGIFTTFNVPGDDRVLGTIALGMNDVGAVVGDYVAKSDGNRHGFLRSSKGDFTTFDARGAAITVGEGINNAGTIVGFYLVDPDGPPHGFVLKNGLFMTVDVPDALATQVFTINAQGKIVGAYVDSEGVQHGFLGVPTQEQ